MKKRLFNLAKVTALSIIICSCGGSQAPVETEEMEDMTEEVMEEVEEPSVEQITLITVEHSVADYDTWHAGYMEKSDPESRIGVLISMDDESMIHVAEMTKSHDAGREMMNSEEIKSAMAEFGVTSEPTFRFLNMVEMNKTDMTDPYCVSVSHTVDDFDAWKVKFDEHASKRAEVGLTTLGLGTLEGEPNSVFAMFSMTDIEAVKAMFDDPKMKEAMEEAGVNSEPEINYWRVPEGTM